ncbi:nicotinate-nucleotide adenylyltransferase [bacterium]|nr:nicotinate-nucleotide adenylyltransferase [bacterium]
MIEDGVSSISRVGLFGGTFDPPTIAHLIAAQYAYDELQLDQVWFILNARNPHKQDITVSDDYIRLEMLHSAIVGKPEFRVETCEIERGGLSYMFDTVKYLKEEHPKIEFLFLGGEDILNGLEHWHRVDELLQEIQFVIFSRPSKRKISTLSKWQRRIKNLEIPGLEISSTLVRERIKVGKSVRYLVPNDVEELIEQHGLYNRT